MRFFGISIVESIKKITTNVTIPTETIGKVGTSPIALQRLAGRRSLQRLGVGPGPTADRGALCVRQRVT